jgi:hypothetical protein
MAQDQQFDILGEFAAPAPEQQPEHSREGEIGERQQHPAILPSAAPEQPAKSRVSRTGNRLHSPARLWYSRAHVKQK